MHMLVKLFFITAACQHNIARASGVCGKPDVPNNAIPVSDFSHQIGASIRIQCADGYVRRAGTSSLIRCIENNGNISWKTDLPLQCIPDPKRPIVPKPETERPHQHFTSSTTERTTRMNTTVHGTIKPTTGANVSMRTSTVSKGNGTMEARSSGYKSTVGGVTGILLICLLAAVFILWWRSKTRRTNRNNPDPNRVTCTFYTPVPQNSAADRSTENSESDNQPQIGIASGADT